MGEGQGGQGSKVPSEVASSLALKGREDTDREGQTWPSAVAGRTSAASSSWEASVALCSGPAEPETSFGAGKEKMPIHRGGDLEVLELGGQSGSLPVCVNKVLLAHSHTPSFRYCL